MANILQSLNKTIIAGTVLLFTGATLTLALELALAFSIVSTSCLSITLPKPKVFFDDFGDSSLDFRLGIWTSSYTDKPEFLKSEIYFAIFKKFKENNIQIPYPQRDVHIKSK